MNHVALFGALCCAGIVLLLVTTLPPPPTVTLRREVKRDWPSSLLKRAVQGFGNGKVPPFLTRPGKGRTVVIVGVADGEEAAAAVLSGFYVIGFEPNPKLLKKAVERIGPHRCKVAQNSSSLTVPQGGKAVLFPFAVGAKKSSGIQFYMDGRFGSAVEKVTSRATVETVPVVVLRDFITQPVHALVVDVQGYEYNVLKGLPTGFQAEFYFLEIYPKGLRAAGVDFTEFLLYLRDTLRLQCYTTAPPGKNAFPEDHPQELYAFAAMLSHYADVATYIGRFDDILCIN